MLESNLSACQGSEKLIERRINCVFLHFINLENQSDKLNILNFISIFSLFKVQLTSFSSILVFS